MTRYFTGWSEQDLQVAKQRMGGKRQQDGLGLGTTEVRTSAQSVTGSVSKDAAASSSPYRSKLEETFAYRLVLEKRTGIIQEFWYEPLNLRLPGEKNFYKPDFLVMADNGLTFYEVKGFSPSNDRSLVKIKTASGMTPWAKFVLVKRVRGQWEERVIT